MPFQFLRRDINFPFYGISRISQTFNQFTYPKNLRAVMLGGRVTPRPSSLTFMVLIVRNSHSARSPSGVPSAVHVYSVIDPSGPPVARTPR